MSDVGLYNMSKGDYRNSLQIMHGVLLYKSEDNGVKLQILIIDVYMNRLNQLLDLGALSRLARVSTQVH